MSEGLSWEQRAVNAEASLQSLRDKVVPLVGKTKELEKEAKVSLCIFDACVCQRRTKQTNAWRKKKKS